MSTDRWAFVVARRRVVSLVTRGIAALGLMSVGAGRALAATDDPSRQRPQPGDILVHLQGPRKGQPVRPGELPPGGPQQLVWPMSPDGVIRNRSRLNQLLVIRLDPAEIVEAFRPFAAGDTLCYSAICTHQCCPVNMWKKENRTLYCSCHGSEYDPAAGAAVVAGPAPERLAVVPLRRDGERLVIADAPVGRFGCRKT
jgi:Rieske Fe-S protein